MPVDPIRLVKEVSQPEIVAALSGRGVVVTKKRTKSNRLLHVTKKVLPSNTG